MRKNILMPGIAALCFLLLSMYPGVQVFSEDGAVETKTSDASDVIDITEKDEIAEGQSPPKVKGKITKTELREFTTQRSITEMDLPLTEWSANSANDFFAAPRFQRSPEGYLEMLPDHTQPHNTFGFWSSPSFTLVQPSEAGDANSITAYIEYSYTATSPGYSAPTIRVRFNRTDFRESSLYQYDGDNLNPAGAQDIISCKFDTNMLLENETFFVSVDLVALEENIDPDFKFTIKNACLMGIEEPAPLQYPIDGLWLEDDSDAKIWTVGSRLGITENCYDGAWSERMAATVKIISDYQNIYDLYIWFEGSSYWLNESDTFQTSVPGIYAAYLEQDGDVKVWSPYKDELIKIKNDGIRISSGGDDALLIWDEDNDLYVWHPDIGLYRVDDDDIWYLCDSTSAPID